jgi:hypothetical protein
VVGLGHVVDLGRDRGDVVETGDRNETGLHLRKRFGGRGRAMHRLWQDKVFLYILGIERGIR